MAVLIVGAVTASPCDALAQLSGHVADESGMPVPGVVVEAHGSTRLLSSTSTDSTGGFRLDALEGSARLEYVVVRRIGYKTAVLTPVESRQIVIQEAPVALPPIAVSLRHEVECGRGEAHALEQLVRLSLRYRPLREGVLTVSLIGAAGAVSAANLGATPMEGLEPGMVRLARRHRESWADRAAIGSYAVKSKGLDLIGKYDGWEYAPFELGLTTLFIEASFLQNTDFYMEDSSAGNQIIAFCTRAPAPVGVRGRLRLNGDHLVQVDWTFAGPSSSGDAGGKALLPPPAADGSTHLLPIESFFWRRKLGETYHQEYYAFRDWSLSD